ncbi:MAG: hypothetical protein M1839_005660 [Geoglossum umbratile]|nr:MAG: hypothetical protein M1839_005660 [Geoglossum umbratile]
MTRNLTEPKRSTSSDSTISNLNSSKYLLRPATEMAALFPIPSLFYRVTNSKSLIKFQHVDDLRNDAFDDPVVSFEVGYTLLMDLCHRINPAVVQSHLKERKIPGLGLISVGTVQKAEKEIEWRQSCRRKDIRVYEISTKALQWESINISGETANVLTTDRDGERVIFFPTSEVTKLGLHSRWATEHEWFALEWIQRDMVTEIRDLKFLLSQ